MNEKHKCFFNILHNCNTRKNTEMQSVRYINVLRQDTLHFCIEYENLMLADLKFKLIPQNFSQVILPS